MSNGVLFGSKEPELTFLNEILNNYGNEFLGFVETISSVWIYFFFFYMRMKFIIVYSL
jgi:hypothetical protein